LIVRRCRLLVLLFFPVLFLPVCAGFSAPAVPAGVAGTEREEKPVDSVFVREFRAGPFPVNAVFSPAPIPDFQPAPGVGMVTREARDLGGGLLPVDRERLAGSFKSAYAEAVLRGADLAGVLGGDMVHGWPPSAPVTWVQNWRGAKGKANSWGIPVLALAVQGLSHDRVFIVQGDILDAYGMSAGLGGANGAAGYGPPCGEEFLLDGRPAQRFDFGLIRFDEGGTAVFIPGSAPAVLTPMPEEVGFSDPPDQRIQDAFESAWRTGINSGMPPPRPDTPVIGVDFGDSPWMLPVEVTAPFGGAAIASEGRVSSVAHNGFLAVRNMYCQSFDGGNILFVMAAAELQYVGGSAPVPFFPRILNQPFLDVLLNAQSRRPEGADSLDPARHSPAYAGKSGLIRLLLDGIALYGIPLSDALFHREGDSIRAAQRFSRGWITFQ
jgi:hypothetical protein